LPVGAPEVGAALAVSPPREKFGKRGQDGANDGSQRQRGGNADATTTKGAPTTGKTAKTPKAR